MMRLFLSLFLLLSSSATAFTAPKVSQLLETHANDIERLQTKAAETISLEEAPYSNPVFFLRYCLDNAEDATAQETALQDTLKWRQGAGQSICDSAVKAVAEATCADQEEGRGRWNNRVVAEAAPHSESITPFLSPAAITTTTSTGDLCYCIRAGQIDDTALMKAVSIDDMAAFFLYVKEVNNLVINDRSLANDSLLKVLTANDLSGVKLVGGSADFRTALSQSSQQAATVYPSSLAGPTLLLNLPRLLAALVKLFTPLFPESVKERIKFQQGPLKGITDLTLLVQPESKERQTFLAQLDELVYSK